MINSDLLNSGYSLKDFYSSIENVISFLGQDQGAVIKTIILLLSFINLSVLFYSYGRFLWSTRKSKIDLTKKSIDCLDSQNKTVRLFFPVSLFTSLGILGTFIGIISTFKIGDQLSNESVQTVFMGMTTAFTTSIWGICASIGFGWLKSFTQGKVSNRIENLKGLVREELHSERYYLQKIYENTAKKDEATDKLGAAADQLANEVGQMSSSMKELSNSLNPEVTAKIIAEAVSVKLAESMAPISHALTEKLNVIDQLAHTTNELKHVNTQLAGFIQNDLNGIFEGVKHSVESSNESIKITNSALEKTKDSLEQQGSNLNSLKDTLNQFSHNMDHVLQKQLDQFKSVSETSVETIRTSGAEMNGLVQESSKQLESVFEKQKTMYQEISESSVNAIQTAGTSMEGLVNNSAQKLDGIINGVDDVLKKTSEATLEELSKFQEEYRSSLDTYLQAQGQHLDQYLKDNAEKLLEVVRSMEDSFHQFHENNKDIASKQDDLASKTLEVVSRSVATTEMHKGMLADASESIAKANSDLVNTLSESNRNYGKVTDSLEGVAVTMKEVEENFKNQVVESLDTYQGAFDNHIATILSNIHNSTELISRTLYDSKQVADSYEEDEEEKAKFVQE